MVPCPTCLKNSIYFAPIPIALLCLSLGFGSSWLRFTKRCVSPREPEVTQLPLNPQLHPRKPQWDGCSGDCPTLSAPEIALFL